MSFVPKAPKVYLVGAGPGDPGLLTLRAVECLREADFVLYDYLTSPRALEMVRPGAETLCVDQLPGQHPQRWPRIHQRIIDEARQGKVVVHLKGGDPLIFGRGAEEAEALREAGIPYEIVPGVTAALAAGAYAELPLTHRAHASAIALVTGHEHPGKANSRLDWDAIARFPGTLAIYMGVARLALLTQELIARGKQADTPAAIVHRASTGEQATVVGTLSDMESRARQAGVGAPSILLVGPAIGLKPTVSWFETRPLLGLHVLVTRPTALAGPILRDLELRGAVPFHLPVIEPRPPADWTAVDAAIGRFDYDWLVFTSANGVSAFFDRLNARGRDARVLGRAKLAAIGSATAAALRERHLVPDLVPTDDLRSERLAELMGERCQGQRVLLAQAAEGRELLREVLGRVATVEAVAVYEQATVVEINHPVFDRLRRGEIHAVLLTSPNIARAFLSACDDVVRSRFRDGPTTLVANSQRLGEVLTTEGYRVLVTARPTSEAMVEALAGLRPTTSHPDTR